MSETKITTFEVDRGGCYNSHSVSGHQNLLQEIGWFLLHGGELRRYEFNDPKGVLTIILVEVRTGRYSRTDSAGRVYPENVLTIHMWEWDLT